MLGLDLIRNWSGIRIGHIAPVPVCATRFERSDPPKGRKGGGEAEEPEPSEGEQRQ